jgi:hypothetical protein
MGAVWAFLRKPGNRQLLAWLGGGAVVLAGGIWAVVTYLWPAYEARKAVCAERSVVIGGNVSGSTVSNRIAGGKAVSGPCLTGTKK